MKGGDTLFVADLHLDPSRPAVGALARRFLERARARAVAELWILGDLFEAWLGDDVAESAHDGVRDALAALSAGGTAVHLMHGNRDFLLGEAFAARAGARLHAEDEIRLALGDAEMLLLHGDTLCSGDVDYRRLRARLRAPAWRADFLAMAPAERRAAAGALRERSREATATKRGDIMDVDPAAVAEAFARSGCTTMIHGHTHRPADHDGTPGARRVVVGDWHDDHARYARHDGHALTLETWR